MKYLLCISALLANLNCFAQQIQPADSAASRSIPTPPVAGSNQFSQPGISTDVPAEPDPHKTYVFYLHGKIIEDAGPRPIDKRFGIYDYPAVLSALNGRGAQIISEQRASNTDGYQYAGRVVAQIERLLRAGIPAAQIVVIGFSKGGNIALHVASYLHRPQVRFVLLAACYNHLEESHLRLSGRLFSVIENSDTLAGMSCQPYTSAAEPGSTFEELQISTGRSHGAFYQPLEAWVEPVLNWIDRTAKSQ